MAAYCGTNDIRVLVETAGKKIIENEDQAPALPSADIVLEAFCRQIAQAVCAHGATLEGKIDGIVFTGGVAHSPVIMKRLITMCGWMAPVVTLPGEREMEALAEGALRALQGEDTVKEYI